MTDDAFPSQTEVASGWPEMKVFESLSEMNHFKYHYV